MTDVIETRRAKRLNQMAEIANDIEEIRSQEDAKKAELKAIREMKEEYQLRLEALAKTDDKQNEIDFGAGD